MTRNLLWDIRFLVLLLFLILAFHAFALYYHWYWTLWWLDIPMHLAGGFLVGASYLWYLKIRDKALGGLLMFSGVVLTVGLLWESHEFLYDLYFKHSTFMISTLAGRFDTLKDLADDLLGGVLAYVWLKD